MWGRRPGVARKTEGPRRVTWERLDTGSLNTAWAVPDTASLPVLQRQRRVPSWTMWSGFAVSVVLCIVCAWAWVELISRW